MESPTLVAIAPSMPRHRRRWIVAASLIAILAIAQWVKQSYSAMDACAYRGLSNTSAGNFGGAGSSSVLYQCGE